MSDEKPKPHPNASEAQRAILDRTVQHFEDVAELVKAARTLIDERYALHDQQWANDESEYDALIKALKPFEAP